MKPDLDEIIKAIPGAKKAADGFIINEDGCLFHAFGIHSADLLEGVTEEEQFYVSFCSKEEILALREIRSSKDYLLWFRAEAIVDSARAVRVFRKRAAKAKKWSLTNYYERRHRLHHDYISNVASKYKQKIKTIPAGMAYMDVANAMCIKSDFGNIVAVSEALWHFLFFMNFAFFGESLGVPSRDCFIALIIAIRIMLGYESLDFDLDTRGDIPFNILSEIKKYTERQIYFIFGHEYAHHTLGHLNDSSLARIKICDIVTASTNRKKVSYYRYPHKKEYDADWFAIKNIKADKYFKSMLADSAFLIFIYFDVLDSVSEFLALSIGMPKTHPKPLDRVWKLRRRLNNKIGSSGDIIRGQISASSQLKHTLVNKWLPYHMDDFETYGALYLPSYKTKILRDRIDY